jgi:dienelactone hydrolase
MLTLMERLQAALRERYRIEGEIGRGGMATVFLAEDLKHHRKVAVKVLLESLTHTIGLRRFLQEIQVIAGLQHPHLLTLIDSGELDGLPYYVMPYVDGQSLRELIASQGQLGVEQAVAIAREIADGLEYAHRHGVIHRDVKPSNILMSASHAMVADFGIATALANAGAGRITETGVSTGSPTYMSPEQAAGERDLDARTDVYSLACVLYEMLCGEPPVDDASMQQVITRKLTGHYRRLREVRPDAPAALDAAITKALSTAREDRYESVKRFADAIAEASHIGHPGPSRRLIMAGAALTAIVIGAVGYRTYQVLGATRQLGEIARLTESAEYASAFALAQQVRPILPNDSTLKVLTPRFTDFIPIVTVPTGARAYRQRIGPTENEWEFLGTTPLDSIAMPKWGQDLTYRLRIEAPGYRTTEVLPNLFASWAVWRRVAPLDTLRLDPLDDGNEGMAWIPGWTAPDLLHPTGDSIRFADYHIGKKEVTNAEFKRFVDAGGYQKRDLWTVPFVQEGRTLSFEEAMAWLRDRSGVPGPSTWSRGTYPDGQADFPVGGVSFYEAAAYARFVGKQLPTGTHWGRAALRHRRETGWIYFPSANLSATAPRATGQGLANEYGLYDVAGNVREWCVNPMEGGRLTRGGGWADAEFLVGHLIPKPEFDRAPSNGFRLMSASDADSSVAHLARRIEPTVTNDYTNAQPVSDGEFAIYRRLVDYDSAPLGAGPRMEAYLFFPGDAEPPYEPILLWGGTGILGLRSLREPWVGSNVTAEDNITGFYGFILRSGRAIVVPLLMGSYERDDSTFSITTHGYGDTPRQRDLWIQWIKELRRTMDYLAERPDIAATKAGFYGYSWGAQIAPMVLALEPRLRAAVVNTGGLWPNGSPLPELNMVNYLPRVRTPVLMLNGRHDVVFPYESSQLPFLRLLGTPVADKKHIVFPTSHTVPQEDNARETLAWFDKYLGLPLSRP